MPVNDQTPSVTLVNSAEVEIATVANPVHTAPDQVGTFGPGAQTAVSTPQVSILAANASRKAMWIQNVGAANIRVGVTGVTATSGIQVVAGATVIIEMPWCPTAEIFAIREGGTDSTVLIGEIT